jgi:hypothetical protein
MAGRKPIGEQAMTPAQYQARYRARLKKREAEQRREQRTLRAQLNKLDRRSRPQRWADAVQELIGLQAEYQEWLDNLPDGLEDSATAMALQAVADLDLSELETIELPQGFGRD